MSIRTEATIVNNHLATGKKVEEIAKLLGRRLDGYELYTSIYQRYDHMLLATELQSPYFSMFFRNCTSLIHRFATLGIHNLKSCQRVVKCYWILYGFPSLPQKESIFFSQPCSPL